MERMERAEGVVLMRRAEIDTRAPFRSVKEAVVLFGERVLAGEVYSSSKFIKEMQEEEGHGKNGEAKLGRVVAELEETKHSLEKAREERMLMANCLSSLKEELERTKEELQQLKVRDSDVKIVEDSVVQVKKESGSTHEEDQEEETRIEFHKKRYVTFANPTPSVAAVAQFLVPQQQQGIEVLERHPSLRKKKKKPLLPLFSALFSKIKPTSPHPQDLLHHSPN